MDEVEGTIVETVGETLRATREARGMGIEEVAATTRIPTRHLESIEQSAWDRLPAPTYSIGFAKSYAHAIGLDKTEIGDRLRTEMGGSRPTPITGPDLFEPTDPKRSMPIGLVIGAVAAILLVALLLTWLNNRSLEGGTEPAPTGVASEAPAAAAAPAASGPVVVTANEAVWVDIRDGATVLKQGELGVGQSFEVPTSATAPTLTTARPEALRISVGTADAPAIGPAGTKVSVSLLGPDLLQGPRSPAPAASPPATTSAPSTPAARRAPAPAPKPTTRQIRPAPSGVVPPPIIEPVVNEVNTPG
jgi:cytoskeletal protein RodZ